MMKRFFIKTIASAIVTILFMAALYLILSFCYWSMNFNQWYDIAKNGSMFYFLTRAVFIVIFVFIFFENLRD